MCAGPSFDWEAPAHEGGPAAVTEPTVLWLGALLLLWYEQECETGRIVAGQDQGQAARLKVILDHPGLADTRAHALRTGREAAIREGKELSPTARPRRPTAPFRADLRDATPLFFR
jgi:hypothetical protein